MKINTKIGILLTIFIAISLININSVTQINKDTIIDTYRNNLIQSLHMLNIKQFNNQEFLNTLEEMNSYNKKVLKDLKKSRFLFNRNSKERNDINFLIVQYNNLNTSIKYASKYLVANKIEAYHSFNSIIKEIVDNLQDPSLSFETNIFNSIINNLGIRNVLNISIENFDFNMTPKDNYNILVESIFIERWSSSVSLVSLKFDTFNSVQNIEKNYPGKFTNYEFKFYNSSLNVYGEFPLEDYINLSFSNNLPENTSFSYEVFENNQKLWISPTFQ